MNYIYYNEFGKEVKKSLSPIAKGSSGIKIYIFSDFDNSSETEYEVSASFKKADGFVAGDIFLPLSSNTKINPYNQQEMYYRELTIGNDVTDIVGGLQLSLRYIQTNVIVVDSETIPPVTYEEKVIHVTGMVTFNIYDATSFISPPQNTALINLKNYLLNYIDTQDANIFEVDRTFLQSLGVTNDLTVYGKIFAHGGLDSRAKKIINVAPPEYPLDAVNKSYVDTATFNILVTKEDLINKITEWSVTPTDDEYPSAKLIKDTIYTKPEIDAKLSATYKPKGTITGTELLAITPSSENEGFVYNISTEFTTTIDFIGGEGVTHVAGENVVIVEITEGVYKFDVLSGFIDLSLYALKTDITDITDIKEDVVFQATSLDSLTSGQKLAITTQINDVLTSGEIDKEKFKNFILEITLTGNKYYYQCVQYFMSVISGIATLYFASTQTTGIIKLYVDTLTPANSTLTNYKYYDGIQASASSFSGSTTNYLQSETNVDEAIKELDTQVKATNDSIPTAYTLPQASTNTRGGIRADIKQATDTVEVKIDVASEKLYAPTYPSKTSDLTNDSGFATETYVNNKVSSVYKIKGSVDDYSSLPTENLTVGDVYNLLDTGDNYVWDGTAWDKLGGTVDLTPYELLSNKVIAWSETTNDTRYPSEKLVKNSLNELENKVEGVSDLSPYHFERTFVGDDILQNDFDNLIVDYEDLKDGHAFKETKLRGSYFVCSAESAFWFNTIYNWSEAEGTGKTSTITYTWAAPYDLSGLTDPINMKPGDIISILDFSYDAGTNTISTIIKVEKNLEEILSSIDNVSIPNISLNDNTATEGKYISKLEIDSVDSHKINITKADLPTVANGLTETLKSNYDAAYTHSQTTHAPSNAEQNVQSNWTQTVETADDYIKNKPTIPTVTNDLTNTLKTNYNAAYTHSQTTHAPSNAEKNVQSNWTQATTTADDYIKNKPSIPTKTSDLTNDSGFATETYVNNKVSAVYKPKGSVSFSSLVVGLLVAANSGFVYNITNAFTTNANFVEGAGKSHSAGTNVAIIEHSGNYKFDVLSGTVDLTPYQLLSNKVTSFNAPTDVQYPSAKLVKNSLNELENKVESVSDLSPYHYEGTFIGDDLLQNDFDNLIVGFENPQDGGFKETKLRGSYFVCSANSAFWFNTIYHWSAAAGGGTSTITYTWAAPYDLTGFTDPINMKPGDIISILDFSYNSGSNTISTIVKVEKNLAEIIPDTSSLLPKSGGTLENYNEKITTLSASSGAINLSLGSVFVQTPSANISYSITNAVSGVAHSFTLIVNMGAIVRTLTFPASVKWQGGTIPDLTTAGKTYILTFLTVNGGTTWLGMFGGEF